MLSYEGVIRKRLRLKGHPDIPPYPEDAPEDAVPVSADMPTAADKDAELEEANRAGTAVEEGESEDKGAGDRERTEAGAADTDEIEKVQDSRTEAQKRHDEVARHREKERLRKAAEKSYREHMDVRLKLPKRVVDTDFNKRLTEEPEHYDLFKTSFTK